MIKNNSRVIAIILFVLVLSGCSSRATTESNKLTQEVSVKTDLPKESSTNNLEDKVIIDDITNWNHPVKSVLKQNDIEVIKLELTDNKTYPTFYVVFPSQIKDNEFILKAIKSIAQANGYWDFTLIDDSKNIKIQVSNDKKNKIVKSYVYNGVNIDVSGKNDVHETQRN